VQLPEAGAILWDSLLSSNIFTAVKNHHQTHMMSQDWRDLQSADLDPDRYVRHY